MALIRPLLRDEVKEPRVSRFDPASQPIFNVAVLSPRRPSQRAGADDLGDQVLQKRLENVRGVGAVTVVGGVKREINVYLKPAALEALRRRRRPGGRRGAQREPGAAAGRRSARSSRSAWCRSTRA